MWAVVIHQFGDPKLLKFQEVPAPEPRGDEVLVQVKAASINPSDVKNVAGTMHGTTLPRIPGRDFAGIVVKGPKELIGRDVWGTGGDIGFTRDGSHAQFLLLPVAGVTNKPAALATDAAGSVALTFVTAWSAIVQAANVAAGETVVIIGAAGGVGSAAAQIAKARGAKVIGAVTSDDQFSAARQNGAQEVLNSRTGSIVAGVQSLTDNRGADIVFDTSGFMFAESVEMVAMGGRMPVITAPPDGKAAFNLRSIYRKELRVIGVDTRRLDTVASAALLAQMSPAFEAGQLRGTAGKAYPLGAAVEAYQQAARGGARIMLRPEM